MTQLIIGVAYLGLALGLRLHDLWATTPCPKDEKECQLSHN